MCPLFKTRGNCVTSFELYSRESLDAFARCLTPLGPCTPERKSSIIDEALRSQADKDENAQARQEESHQQKAALQSGQIDDDLGVD